MDSRSTYTDVVIDCIVGEVWSFAVAAVEIGFLVDRPAVRHENDLWDNRPRRHLHFREGMRPAHRPGWTVHSLRVWRSWGRWVSAGLNLFCPPRI